MRHGRQKSKAWSHKPCKRITGCHQKLASTRGRELFRPHMKRILNGKQKRQTTCLLHCTTYCCISIAPASKIHTLKDKPCSRKQGKPLPAASAAVYLLSTASRSQPATEATTTPRSPVQTSSWARGHSESDSKGQVQVFSRSRRGACGIHGV